MISIKDYSNYRDFLRDFHDYKKKSVGGWSYRLFASRSGIASPNYLQLVMQEKRNLSEETAEKVAGAMKLQPLEKDYFLALVRESNARSPEEELQATKQVLRSLRKLNTTEIKSSEAEILEKWYHMTVRELANIEGFQFDPSWVSQKLFGTISEDEAEESLRFLLSAGWIQQIESGRWQTSEPILDTGLGGFKKQLINDYHKNTLQYFSEVIDKINLEDRELGLLTISMRKDQVQELKKKLQEFQDEIIGWLGDVENPDEVVQLGTYLLPANKGQK